MIKLKVFLLLLFLDCQGVVLSPWKHIEMTPLVNMVSITDSSRDCNK